MKRPRVNPKIVVFAIFISFVTMLLSSETSAAITVTGDVDPIYTGLDPWNISPTLQVGITSGGTMAITDGSCTLNGNAFIGLFPNSLGSVTVTGPSSSWHNSRDLNLGYCGNANMVISAGGRVFNRNAHVAHHPNSSVSVTVSGPDSCWDNLGTMMFGYCGQATMLVSNGGTVRTSNYGNNVHIGSTSANPNVSITITGSNSQLYASGFIALYRGGSLNIIDGGLVDCDYANIGYDSDYTSTVTLAGPGSLWNIRNSLSIGLNGNGSGELLISGGGRVTCQQAEIGVHSDSKARVTVAGSNSRWEQSGELYIGGSSWGARGLATLNISDGGTVEADNVTIWSTGTVTGDGTLKANTVTHKGTFKPGNSIGTMTIDGHLTMDAGSLLEIEVGNNANSDKILVTGNANIAGGSLNGVRTATITGEQHYSIIQADGVVGTFDTLDMSLLDTALLNPDVTYQPDSISLRVSALPFDDTSIASMGNQKALGSALQQIAVEGGNSITFALQGLETTTQVHSAYAQLSGQSRPPLAPITTAGLSKFIGTVSDRVRNSQADVAYGFRAGPLLAMAEPDKSTGDAGTLDVSPSGSMFAIGSGTDYFGDQNWGVWGRGYGMFGDRETTNNSPGYRYTIYGTSFGLDYRFTQNLLLGVTGGCSDGDINYFSSSESSNVTSRHIGLYGSWNTRKWYFDSVLTYTGLKYETERYIALTGEKLEGDYDGRAVSGYFEAGLNWYGRNGYLIQPLASFQFSCLDLDSYTESGGVSALAYDDQSYQSQKGSLGMKLTRHIYRRDDGRNALVQFRGRWVREFGDTESSVIARFASTPAATFTVSDGHTSRNSAVFGAGFSATLRRSLWLSVDYDTSLSSDDTAHVIGVGLMYRW